MLNNLQEVGKVEGHQNFFDKHPILEMAFSAITAWGIENGIDSLVGMISNTFR